MDCEGSPGTPSRFGLLSRASHQITSPWRLARVRAPVDLAPQPPPLQPASPQRNSQRNSLINPHYIRNVQPDHSGSVPIRLFLPPSHPRSCTLSTHLGLL